MFDTAAMLRAFDQANGKHVFVNGWCYFANGAKREADVLGCGPMFDPPEDDYKRLVNCRVYRQAVLDRALKAFQDAKHKFLEDAYYAKKLGTLPPNVEEAESELEDLARKVRIAERALTFVDKQLAETPEGRAKAFREQSIAESRANSLKEADEFERRIKAIGV